MQFASLKVFCDVARQRSFSQAAHVNHVTQSAVSQMVSQLERRMQVQLIDRSTRPLQLTALGQTFYEGAKKLISEYTDLEARVRAAHADIAGSLQVAAIYSVGLGDMGQYVQRMVAEDANVRVHIEYLHPDRVYEKVLDGSADLGLVSYPRRSAKVAALPWREEEMVLVCPPRHVLAENGAVHLPELAGVKYVHFDRNLAIRKKVDRFLKENGAVVDVALEFDNIENIKQAISIGAGVALLPEPSVRREVKNRTVIALPLAGSRFTRPLGIIHRRRQKLSGAARRFIEILTEDERPVFARAQAGSYVAGTPNGALTRDSRPKHIGRAYARS